MIYYKGSSNGSGSSDPDRNEGKKNGDVCEGNVYIIDSEYRNMEHVDHVRDLFQPNQTYTSCHGFLCPEDGLKGETNIKFT